MQMLPNSAGTRGARRTIRGISQCITYVNDSSERGARAATSTDALRTTAPVDQVQIPAAITASVNRYKALIACLPSSSKYLLCYVLDLLNVFARQHEMNLMPASNLAVVFQPGLIRSPDTDSLPLPVPIPGASGGQAGNDSLDSSAMTPPQFPQLSRSSSNPISKALTQTTSNGDGHGNNSLYAELQRRQDEIKINQEVLAFLINHQDQLVALPELPTSSAENSPITPSSGPEKQAQSTRPHKTSQSDERSSRTLVLSPVQLPAQHNTLQPAHKSPFQSTKSAPIQPSTTAMRAPTSSPFPPGSNAFRGIQAETPGYARSPASSREREAPPIPASISTSNAFSASPSGSATATFPTSSSQPQSAANRAPPASARTSKEKEKEREKEEQRKPRKLKKGRTPTTSGSNTPLSPSHGRQTPIRDASRSSTPDAQKLLHIQAGRSSTPPAQQVLAAATVNYYIAGDVDDDVPLAAIGAVPGPGVKRSRTLPSPGEVSRANSSTSVCVFPR